MTSRSNALLLNSSDNYNLANVGTISWGIAGTLPTYYSGMGHSGAAAFVSLTPHAGTFVEVFASIAEVISRSIVQTSANPSTADIVLNGSSVGGSGLAYSNAVIGDTESDNPDARYDLWFFAGATSLSADRLAAVARHEVLHSLGFRHSHQDLPGMTFEPANTIYNSPIHEQSWKYSVMSYVAPTALVGGDFASGTVPSTLQLYDIWTLQSVYGIDTTTRAETGTVYGTGANIFDAGADSPALATIWDAGGDHDLLDASASSTSAIIDLRQGEFSSIGASNSLSAPLENIAIAWRTVIEDATGTAQQDVIIGNIADNFIKGEDGDDLIFGDGDAYGTHKQNVFQELR